MCRHKSFWRGTECSQIFGLTQKIWTNSKHFATCKRTRHQFHQGRGVPFLTRQDDQKKCDLFLTISIKKYIHFTFFFGNFWKKVLLTAEIKNTNLVALKSAEILYHNFDLQLISALLLFPYTLITLHFTFPILWFPYSLISLL